MLLMALVSPISLLLLPSSFCSCWAKKNSLNTSSITLKKMCSSFSRTLIMTIRSFFWRSSHWERSIIFALSFSMFVSISVFDVLNW